LALLKASGTTFLGWLLGKALDVLVPPTLGGVRQVISAPWFQPLLAALGLALGLLWAAWPWLAPHLRRLGSKASPVRGEVVLFELISPTNHPEMYANREPKALEKAIAYGSAFDVGLHIENNGKPSRLRGWRFRVDLDGESHSPSLVEADAWPPPQAWQRLFPDTISLPTVEATYLHRGKVYPVYFRLRFMSPDYSTFPRRDALVVSATDNFGRVATFRARDDHAAFEKYSSIPNS
jgi:hypothetical protein